MNILHIAPFNTAGVPITLVKAEREIGHHSRLITLGHDRRDYEEDICLNLPLLDFWLTRVAKRLFSSPDKLKVTNRLPQPASIPIEWHPNNAAEDLLVRTRETLWTRRIAAAMEEVDFWEFDLYQLDGGLEFYRDGRTVRRLKEMGKRIICCYTGSDLRTRGIIPVIDRLCDVRVTVEFDHLRLHPRIHHVFFPFDVRRFEFCPPASGETVRIGHAPTNRAAKGSDTVIRVVRELAQSHPVELVLIEGLPWREATRLKRSCHIFVDQLGDLGYGINSLEALAMGIPTCSCLAPGFAQRYPDHPFVVVDEENLPEQLLRLIGDPELRRAMGVAGRRWVERTHDPRRIARQIHRLAGLAGDGKGPGHAVTGGE